MPTQCIFDQTTCKKKTAPDNQEQFTFRNITNLPAPLRGLCFVTVPRLFALGVTRLKAQLCGRGDGT